MNFEKINAVPQWEAGAKNYLVELEAKSKYQRESIDEFNEKIYSPGLGVVVVTREGADEDLLKNGFLPANDGVPEIFAKGDPTKFLLYSKRL